MKYLLLLLMSVSASAMDYDVNYAIIHDGYYIYEIEVDGCKTQFKVKIEDHKKLTDEAIAQAADLAIERAKNGCK